MGALLEDLLKRLRQSGWMVAVHNDYRLDGVDGSFTFWLFTHGAGVFVRGEGRTDCDAVRAATLEAERKHPDLIA